MGWVGLPCKWGDSDCDPVTPSVSPPLSLLLPAVTGILTPSNKGNGPEGPSTYHGQEQSARYARPRARVRGDDPSLGQFPRERPAGGHGEEAKDERPVTAMVVRWPICVCAVSGAGCGGGLEARSCLSMRASDDGRGERVLLWCLPLWRGAEQSGAERSRGCAEWCEPEVRLPLTTKGV